MKQALQEAGIRQEDAAKILGYSRTTISSWYGKAVLDDEIVKMVKDKLGVDLTNVKSLDSVVNQNSSELISLRRNKPTNEALIPFYNADFMAGNAEAYYDDKTIHPEYYMDIPEFYGCTAFRAYSDSMEKKIKSGSILFGIKLEEWNVHLEFGQIYGITCLDKRRYLKYIKRDELNKDNFLLVSENHHYQDFELPKNRIKNIWLIEGWIDKRT